MIIVVDVSVIFRIVIPMMNDTLPVLGTIAQTGVDLTTYDYIVLNTSGGKDSQAMIDFVVKLAEQAGADPS